MSDVFVSYARSTEREAKAVAEALRALGYGVWRDDEIPAHRSFAEVIEERLRLSKAVVVVWSAEAAKSAWVQSEADRARADGKLIQLSLDNTPLPMPFDRIQCADLARWSGQPDHPGWLKVAASVAELVGQAGTSAKAAARASPARTHAICVLPFINMSGDPEQEYFSDGISEDIITDLSKVSALSVVARNTAFNFKGQRVDIPEVAQKLGVSHVLEGSVRKAGNRLRITAQLIDGKVGDHVWADRWDRDLDDIFALQDEISQAIVAALKVRLLPEEKKAIENRGTDNVEAYNLYLMARRHIQSQSARRFDLIKRLCQGAVDLDPAYAHAWALLARIKAAGVTSYSKDKTDDGWAEVERALELDPDLAEAHGTKSRLLRARGQFDEAQAEAHIALRFDPHSVEANNAAGQSALAARRFAEAIRYFEAAADADEQDGASPFMALQCYEALGDADGARAAARKAVDRLEKAIAREPDNGGLLAFGVGALVVLGEADRARDWAKHALLIDPEDGILRYNLACAMTRLDDVDLALEYLDTALELGGASNVHWARKDSDLDRLRQDPRFEALMKRAEARLAGQESPAGG